MNIPKDALEFSINHINRYYDSDFFPKLSEYVVINTRWNDVVSYLNSLNIEEYKPFTANAKAAPKSDGSFRIVHQLDPIDTLIYTSFSYLVAESVEKCRPVVEDGVSCSYRFNIDPKGTFFDERNGYLQYVDRSRQLSENYPYVLLCDIAAFYNHIYVHRLQNIIEAVILHYKNCQKLLKILLLD